MSCSVTGPQAGNGNLRYFEWGKRLEGPDLWETRGLTWISLSLEKMVASKTENAGEAWRAVDKSRGACYFEPPNKGVAIFGKQPDASIWRMAYGPTEPVH